MVELFEQNIRTKDRQSSKGNQLNGRITEFGIKLITQGMRDWQNM